jgi:predicted component of type VI protein secretion system
LIALPCLGFVFLGIPLSKGRIRKRSYRAMLLLLLTVTLLLSIAACSSIQRSNLPCTSCTTAGTYTVSVTATTSTNPAFQASGAFTIVVGQ